MRDRAPAHDSHERNEDDLQDVVRLEGLVELRGDLPHEYARVMLLGALEQRHERVELD